MATKAMVAASTKPLILSILSRGESYGYQIIRNIESLSGGRLEWTEAMLYPFLHRLERDGFIQSRWHIAENGRKRKYYSITEMGEKELEFERTQWLDVHSLLSLLWNPDSNLSLG